MTCGVFCKEEDFSAEEAKLRERKKAEAFIKKHGNKGAFKFKNGDEYIGEWFGNKRHGYGT